MTKFLITRVKEDKATRYLYYWCEELIEFAEKNWDVYKLSNKKANRKTLESYLRKKKPTLVIFNGHGSEDTVVGFNNEALISLNDNEHLLAEMNVYIRACTAGRLLGQSIKAKGATGFIGYKEPFVFWLDPTTNLSRPLQDPDAEPFRVCSNQVATSLLKGHKVREAHNFSMKIYVREISKLLTSGSKRTYLVPELISNMRSQVCYD